MTPLQQVIDKDVKRRIPDEATARRCVAGIAKHLREHESPLSAADLEYSVELLQAAQRERDAQTTNNFWDIQHYTLSIPGNGFTPSMEQSAWGEYVKWSDAKRLLTAAIRSSSLTPGDKS